MKQSTKDRAAGKVEEVKGKLKEKAGQISNNPDLEADGMAEEIAGKVREAISKIQKAETD